MRNLEQLGLVMTLTAALAGVSGCGMSYGYDTGSVRTMPGAERLHASSTEMLDARAGGRRLPSSGGDAQDDELRQVRASVRDHLERAGVISVDAPTVAAPTNPAEVESVLASAAAAGSTEVIFVRYHGTGMFPACGSVAILAPYVGLLPWLIIDSIPLWRHGAYAAFEVMAVSTQTREVLARSVRTASFGEHVSAWGCGADGVMHDMELRAMQNALSDVVAQGAAGWPNRTAVPDVLAEVVAGASARRSGDHVVGTGYRLDIPASWESAPWDPALPQLDGLFNGPDGVGVSIEVSAADENQDFPVNLTNAYRALPSYGNETRPAMPTGQTAIQFEFTVTAPADAPVQGSVLTVGRVMASDGLAVVVLCSGSSTPTHRADCERIVGSMAFTDALISDDQRHDPS